MKSFGYWIIRNQLSSNDLITKLSLNSNNSSSNTEDIESESSIQNAKEETSDISQTQAQQTHPQICCCNNNKSCSIFNNKLTIKQFIQSYTDFSKFEFDAQQSLKMVSFY